ncbi:MAG: class I SAM-dependent methyltransferase [Pseudomonadota bacterium]
MWSIVEEERAVATKADWMGRVGKEWAKRSDALDALLAPVGDVGLQKMGGVAGEQILDLGCGAGTTALALAQTGATITGVDVSPDLLGLAAERDEADAVNWVLGDASAIKYPTAFDGLYSRCGAMFFDQPMIAFAHLRFQMRPGARLVVVCWRDAEQNAWARVPLEAAQDILGAEMTALPPAGGIGPFGWARAQTFIDILQSTGWSDLEHDPVDRLAPVGQVDDDDPLESAVAQCLRIGPLASRLRAAPPTTKTLVADALRKTLERFQHKDGAVKLGSAAWVISARA